MQSTPAARFKAPNFTTLLVVLLVLLMVPPLLPSVPDFLLELAFDAVLVAGVIAAGGAGRHMRPLAVLTVVTLAVRWLILGQGLMFSQSHMSLSVLSTVLTLSWIAYTTAIIVSALFKKQDVTGNAIVGAIVAYLLAALAFAIVYALMIQLSPGAISNVTADSKGGIFRDILYFSLISITTMGYGDMVPVTDAARMFAAFEGVFGQLYIAVMVARLVGLHIASRRD